MSNSNITSNIVNKETLRAVQVNTMGYLKNALLCSFGPFGSNTVISKDGGLPRYTKDGHTILSSIQFGGAIERSVLEDVEAQTRRQAIKVGDSTTSITILSAIIFRNLVEYEKRNPNITPVSIVRSFKEAVEKIKDKIASRATEATIDDLYNICLISTNGDKNLADQLYQIFNEYGKNVYIDVKASTNGQSFVKEINGMVMECGYMDTVLVNNTADNTCTIPSPLIYAFEDPIDTPEMASIFDAIINDNIVEPIRNKTGDFVPTVIFAPKFSRDCSGYIDSIVEMLAQCKDNTKPPLLIVTNIAPSDMTAYADICSFCGCKMIKKYIDPKMQESDINLGLAVDYKNPSSVHKMAGSAARIVSDFSKTTVMSPAEMYNENGEHSDKYRQTISWLNAEIAKAEAEGENSKEIYELKKRLNSLNGNMVEVFVGGVTVADRDQARDLMEDAVLNCRSAVASGVGYGANYEGLIASAAFKNENDMHRIIYDSFFELATLLYMSSGLEEQPAKDVVVESGRQGCPLNLTTKEYDKKVLSSIDTDIYTLDTISKIITLMATANQFMLPTLNINNY